MQQFRVVPIITTFLIVIVIQTTLLFSIMPAEPGHSGTGADTWQFYYPDTKKALLLSEAVHSGSFHFHNTPEAELVEVYGRYGPAVLSPGKPLCRILLFEGDTVRFEETIRAPDNPLPGQTLYARFYMAPALGIDRIRIMRDNAGTFPKKSFIRIEKVALGIRAGEKPRARVLDFHPTSLGHEIIWSFSEKELTAWTCSHPGAFRRMENGILYVDIPQAWKGMESPLLDDIPAEDYAFFEVRMKTDTGVGRGYLFWTTRAEPEWSHTKRIGFLIKGSSKYRRYILDLSRAPGWKGQIRKLGLLPLDHAGSVRIDSMTLFDAPVLGFLAKHTGAVRKDYLFYLFLLIWLVMLLIGRIIGRTEPIHRWNQKMLFRGMLLLLAAVLIFPFSFYPGLKLNFQGIHLIPPAAALVFLALFRLAGGTGKKRDSFLRRNREFFRTDIFLCLFLAFSFLCFLRTGGDKGALHYYLHYYLSGGLVFFLARTLWKKNGERWCRWLFYTVLGLGMLLSVEGLSSFLIQSDLFYDHFYRIFTPGYYQVPVQRISASLVHPTVFGSFLLFPLGTGLAYLYYGKQPAKIIGAISVVLVLLALFLTFSRGCWLSGCVVMFFFMKNKGWKRIIAIGLLIVAVLSASILISPHARSALEKRLTFMREETRHRMSGLLTAGKMGVSSFIFGVGPGKYPDLEPEYRVLKVEKEQTHWKTPDNMYLRIFAETGIPGLLLFLLFLYLALKNMAMLKDAVSPQEKITAAAPRAACAGFLVNLLFYDGLYWFAPMLVFFLFLGTGVREDGNHDYIENSG